MNIRHRRVHRALWPVIAFVLLPTAALGLALRREIPPMEALPESMTPRPSPSSAPLWRVDDAFEGASVQLAVWTDCVELSVLQPLYRPDPFVYYSRSAPQRKALPKDAVLLGMLPDNGVQRFIVPGPIGYIVLFSLADSEVIATAPLGGRR